ncbi:MAG: hypothetical protein AAGP08_06925, partial [Pseudomonadota bacterium]
QNFTYTREGSPLMLQMPVEPGDYIIAYYLDQDRTKLAEATITLTAPEVSVTAPATAEAGSMIEVGWVGPNYTNDYIGVGAVGATGNKRWQNFTYTREGSPLMLRMPIGTGEYVISYFLDQDRTKMAETTITLTLPEVSIIAPSSAAAGSQVEIGWTGPGYANDYIGIGAPGATGNKRWEKFKYTREGSPLMLQMPDTPGAYVIQYYADQDRTPLGDPVEITVE